MACANDPTLYDASSNTVTEVTLGGADFQGIDTGGHGAVLSGAQASGGVTYGTAGMLAVRRLQSTPLHHCYGLHVLPIREHTSYYAGLVGYFAGPLTCQEETAKKRLWTAVFPPTPGRPCPIHH
jgi:hypothetical protein